jgi:hypothetical protein
MRSDDVLARAEEALKRASGRSRLDQRALQRVARAGIVKAKRVAWLAAAFLFGVPLWALFIQPIGIVGLMLAVMGFAGLALAAVLISAGVNVPERVDPSTALAQLPLSTEAWLASQRRALPPPAQRLADGIGLKLEQLAPQLARLDESTPAALSVRRLIADELPELVNGYGRVPPHLRIEGVNGLSPDRQLIDGLTLVDSELARMSTQIASGDLDQLATQKRYLEIKYQGDDSAV